MIPFNKPFIAGKELEYIREAVESGKISGDGKFTIRCQKELQSAFGFEKVLLTTSCTDALEMAALLLNIKEGDEVIMPSYNFVSAANAFALRGARIVFADIDPLTLNISPEEIEKKLTADSKAIVIVHYGGVACEMDKIIQISKAYKTPVIEDAALAFDSYFISGSGQKRILGSFGDFATFSFHETKNIIAGEGGAIVINNKKYIDRAEVIREKGTDRSRLFRGEVDKYTWQDLGSSFLPSEVTAAFLFGQLENKSIIQTKRKYLWEQYYKLLKPLEEEGLLKLPFIPEYATVNGQMFWLLCKDERQRNRLISYLEENKIKAVFHYLPLHLSPYYQKHYTAPDLPVTKKVSESIVRLPLYYDLSSKEIEIITSHVKQFFYNYSS